MDATSLRHALCGQIAIKEIEDGLRVSTQCLYPSNSAVTLSVRGGTGAFVVSDDGGAIEELESSGLRGAIPDRQIRSLVKRQGLRVSEGAILTPFVRSVALPAAILLCANASKALAEWGYQHTRFVVARNFKRELEIVLQRHFNEALKNDTYIVGESNKQHRFAHVIHLAGDRRLLVDPVVNDASSINARVVANMDVRNRRDPEIQQMIVYDDQLQWPSSDLRLLQLGSPNVVPFSLAEPQIQKLAA